MIDPLDLHLPVTLAYVGPDQILPLTSVLGAIVGVLLIFWRYVVALFRRVVQFFTRNFNY